MTRQTSTIVPRLLLAPVIAILAVEAAGCTAQKRAEPSTDAAPSLTRPCDPTTLRLHGRFQGGLGSQFGGVTISTSGERTCQLRGGRPRVLVYVAGRPIPLTQTHSKDVALSDGPRVVTIPVIPNRSGPGFGFEWQETCLPKGRISVRVEFPGTDLRLRVAHEDRINGPRCTPGSGVEPQVFVSLLVADFDGLIIN